jgi:cardiolipin synthase (CMP-forming)
VTLPNLITIARLIAVPVLVLLLLDGRFTAAFALFVIAGISDAVDGTIARYVPGQASELGAYLDPIADKALLVSIFVTLGIIGHIPAWLVILVVSRDLLIVGGILLSWILSNPVIIDPLKISKLNTAAQIVFAAMVLADLGIHWQLGWLTGALVWIVAALTIASAAAYLIGWVRHMGAGGAE